jgi:hypothetical protein
MGNVLKIFALFLALAGVGIYLFLQPSGGPGPTPPEPAPSAATSSTTSSTTPPEAAAPAVTFEPRPERRVALSGRVADEREQTLPGVEVELDRAYGDLGARTWRSEGSTFTGPDGSFRFEEMTSGTFRLRAAMPGRATAESIRFVDANAPVTEFLLVLEPGSTISGVVRAGLGQPVSGARVIAFDERGREDDSPTDVLLRLLELDSIQTEVGISTTTDETGAFTLEGLDPEKRYRLRASAPGQAGAELRYIPAGAIEADFSLNIGGNLIGTVVCEGSPVAGATLSLRRQPRSESGDAVSAVEMIQEMALAPIATVTTDAEGRYRFDSLDGSAPYVVEVRAAGHRPTRFEEIRVDGGQTLESPLEILRGLVIEGLIRGPDGEPLPGAVCRIQPSGATGELGPFAGTAPEETVLSGADGRFRIDTLTDTTYSIAVRHPEFVSRLLRDVLPESGPLEVTLPLGSRLLGRVLEATERTPLIGVEIAVPDLGGQQRMARTDGEGRFELRGLDPGRGKLVVLSASTPGFEPRVGLRIPLDPAKEGPETEIVLRRNGSIRGIVLDFEGRPVGGATISAIRPSTKTGGVATVSPRVRSDGAGRFHLEDVLPGAGTILQGQHPAYIQSYGEPFTVLPDAETGDLELVLQIGGDVLGRVVDPEGNPIEGAVVGVRNDQLGIDDPALMPIHAITDESGRYTLRRIQAGEVTLIAAAPEYLGSQLTGVEVVEGRRIEDVELHLTRGGRISGYVRDIYGEGIEDAEVLALDTSFGLKKFTDRTDENGYFVFTRLGPYPVDVEATAQHHAKERVSQHPPNQDEELVIVLQAFGGVRGDVERADGSALESYNVSPRLITEDGRVLPRVASRSFTTPTFDFGGLVPGDYEILVGASGHAPHVHSNVRVRQKRFTDLPTSRLDSGGVITGTIYELSSGYALPEARITLLGGEENFHDDAATGPPRRQGAPLPGVPIGEDGTFRVSGIFYDVVTLKAECPGMITQILDVNVGTEGLAIAMQPGGRIEGTVHGPQGSLVSSQQVLLTGPTGSEPQRATTDRRGQFVFPGLLPGTYVIQVTPLTREEVEKGSPVRRVVTEEVEVRAGEAAEVDLYYD